MKGTTSRRTALGTILAAPLASAPAAAASFALSDDEVRFLALGPQIVPMLDEYDRIWEAMHPFYEAYRVASEKFVGPDFDKGHGIPEWHAYIEIRQPADNIDDALDDVLVSFDGVRFVSPEAILLRHRVAMTFDRYEDEVAADVRAYWAGRACA